jgi:hypothetical protein
VRALIFSAAGLSLQDVARAALNVGVENAWVHTADLGDPPFDDSLPDFVIAILDPDPSPTRTANLTGGPPFTNVDVAIRAGRAAGQGYPVLLIAPPPLTRPADLPGVVLALCPLDDFDALRLHMWAFAATLPARSQLPTRQPVAQPIAFDATSILGELYSIDGHQQSAPLQVERLIASLLSQVGAELVENTEHARRDNRIDLAFLPSRDAADIVLVEIKVGRLNQDVLAAAERQLHDYVVSRRADLGLVLYHDFEGRNLPSTSATPLIVRMSVRQLIAGLVTNSLPQLLRGVVSDAARRT